MGVEFSADVPWRIFNSKGTVWLSAVPTVDTSGKLLSLKDVAITRQLDNSLWKTLTAGFRDVLNKQVEDQFRYDLSPDEAKAKAALQTATADPLKTGGVKLTVSNPSIKFGRVGVADKSFTLEALISADWSATLDDIKL